MMLITLNASSQGSIKDEMITVVHKKNFNLDFALHLRCGFDVF